MTPNLLLLFTFNQVPVKVDILNLTIESLTFFKSLHSSFHYDVFIFWKSHMCIFIWVHLFPLMFRFIIFSFFLELNSEEWVEIRRGRQNYISDRKQYTGRMKSWLSIALSPTSRAVHDWQEPDHGALFFFFPPISAGDGVSYRIK